MHTIREEARLPGLEEPIIREHTGLTIRQALDKALEEFTESKRPSERIRNIMVHDLELGGLSYCRLSTYHLTD